MQVAVWNTAFLGDAVLSLPLLHSLSEIPNIELDFYLRPSLGELFENIWVKNNPRFKVFEVHKKNSLKSVLTQAKLLRKRDYDILISAHQSFRTSLTSLFSLIPIRIGYNTTWHQRLAYTHTVSRKFNELPETKRILQLLKPLETLLPPFPLCEWPNIILPAALETKAEQYFSSLPPGKVLGLHPGSTWGTKRWPARYYAQIANLALAQNINVLLFGTNEEREICNQVLAGIEQTNSPKLHNLSGKLSLPELTAYLKFLDCYLSNDSGPMHLAWAQHVKLVALFGPTVQGFGFFPQGEQSSVLEINNLDCRPCHVHGPKVCPKNNHACMENILPAQVWKHLSRKLEL